MSLRGCFGFGRRPRPTLDRQAEDGLRELGPVNSTAGTRKALSHGLILSVEHVLSLQKLFNLITNSVDGDHDDQNLKRMSRDDFHMALSNATAAKTGAPRGATTDAISQHLFSLFDSKHEESLDFNAFARAVCVFHRKAPREEKIVFGFNTCDLLKQGFIDTEVLKSISASVGQPSTAKIQRKIDLTSGAF